MRQSENTNNKLGAMWGFTGFSTKVHQKGLGSSYGPLEPQLQDRTTASEIAAYRHPKEHLVTSVSTYTDKNELYKDGNIII